ncbi:LVIVD repeat-containing protein, partial [Echinicola sediminis]
LPILAGLFAGILYSCNPDEQIESANNENIVINNDETSLSSRLLSDNAGVVGINIGGAAGARLAEDELANNLPMELIAQVEAPVYEGSTLQATHVDINGDYAYVTYNTQGPVFLGAIDIFDISNVLEPKITSQAIFKGADLNSVKYANGKIYIAASVDIDGDFEVEGAANLAVVNTSGGKFTSSFELYSVSGYSATDVTHTGNEIVLTSGTDGSITVFDEDGYEIEASKEFPDLRSVAYGDNKLFVFDGDQGINFLNSNNLTINRTINLDEDISGAKRTMEVRDGELFVAKGKDGASLYNTNSGDESSQFEILVVSEGLNSEEVVTNAVTLNRTHLFMANGAAGVQAISYESDDDDDEDDRIQALKVLGVLDLFGSSNFVKANDEYLFVASGLQGLQILKINLPDEDGSSEIQCEGLPTYSGKSNLNVNSNDNEGYAGSLSVRGANINGIFTFCGSMAVQNQLNINSKGIFNMSGSLAIGQNKRNTVFNLNGTMKIEGHLVIYGNMNMNKNGRLEFLGEDSSITIYGDFKNNGGTIVGEYDDKLGKMDDDDDDDDDDDNDDD